MKQRIVLDLTFLHDQYFRRGIGRYGIEMAKRYLQLNSETYELIMLGFDTKASNLERLELDPRQFSGIEFISLGEPKLSSPASNLKMYFGKIKPLVKQLEPDLYIAAHFDRGLPTELCKVSVAVHDVIPLATGKYSKQGAIINFLKGIFYKSMFSKVKDCSAIFTSSNFSKLDLIKIGKLPEEKVHVVYLGVSEVFSPETVQQADPNQIAVKFFGKDSIPTYLIYDAGFEANKNTGQLLDVWEELSKQIPNLKLVVTGGDFRIDTHEGNQTSYTPVNERSKEFVDIATKIGLVENLVPVGRVSEQELVALTGLAAAYINLSSYEGFGFGPVQAMRVGTPAIAANSTSLKEVAGEAGLMVELKEWRNYIPQMIRLITNQELREQFIQRGLAHAKNFNWDNTFNQTWKILKPIISN